jgi:hypothetical protein
MFMFASGNQYVGDFVGTGLMRPGDTVIVKTDMDSTPGDTMVGMVAGRDVRERTIVWNGTGRRKQFRRTRRSKSRTIQDLFHVMHPDVDRAALTVAPYHVIERPRTL